MREHLESEPSELTFQRAYARFLTDTAFREAVFSDEPLEEHWKVKPEVVERLRGLDAERASLFAELLISNSLATVQEALPNTAALLGSKLLEIVRAFNDEALSVNHRKYPEACAFARYLLGRLEQESLGPYYLHDILVYELSGLRLRFEYDEPFWPEEVTTSKRKFIAALRGGRSVYIHRHPYQTLLSLLYDVEQICKDIAASKRPAEVEPKTFIILLHISAGGVLQQEAINAATAALLLAVDGRSTFDQIVDRLAKLFDQRGSEAQARLRASVQELCMELLRRGVIGLTFGSASTGS